MAKKRNVMEKGPERWEHIDESKSKEAENDEFNAMKLLMMSTLADMGVTPEEYAAFLSDTNAVNEQIANLKAMADDFGFGDDDRYEPEPAVAMAEADKKSLRLRVQMKDVTKPPMWREIVVPADFNFSQLHFAIQAATGLEKSHLWVFQRHAYDRGMHIGIPMNGNMGFGIDDCTHDADKTPVSAFLAKKGDKLEYVYDFGDDWIFTVSVIEVTDRQGDIAICTKWKCDFQPIEDCGGVYAYLELRDIFSDPKSLTAKQKREVSDRFCFESFKDLSRWIADSMFEPEKVNERMAKIPDSGRIVY